MINSFQTEIRRQLQLADNATIHHYKGKFLENLACFLFEAIPGITVIARNTKDIFETEEIDIVVYNEFFQGGLPTPAFPPYIFIECKNWSKKVGSEQVSWFDRKLKDRRLPLGILVATQGITGNPHDLTDAHSVVSTALFEGRKILMITREDIEELIHGTDLARLLKEKLGRLFLTRTCF